RALECSLRTGAAKSSTLLANGSAARTNCLNGRLYAPPASPLHGNFPTGSATEPTSLLHSRIAARPFSGCVTVFFIPDVIFKYLKAKHYGNHLRTRAARLGRIYWPAPPRTSARYPRARDWRSPHRLRLRRA